MTSPTRPDSEQIPSYIQKLPNGNRKGHLLMLSPLTDWVGETWRAGFLQYSVAAFLALKHLNARDGSVLKNLPELLEGCDFVFSAEFYDTQYSARRSVQKLIDLIDSEGHVPFAMYGALFSSVSMQLSVVGNALGVPQISSASTGLDLDHPDNLFARTVPTDEGKSRATITYLRSLGVTHAVVLFVQNPWGRSIHQLLQQEAQVQGIDLFSVPYLERATSSDAEDIFNQLKVLSKMEYRYFLLVAPHSMEAVLETAHDLGILGTPGYCWLSFALPRQYTTNSTILAKAFQGMGSVEADFEDQGDLQKAFDNFVSSRALQEEFVSLQVEPELFANHTFVADEYVAYVRLAYDAIIALGLAACRTPGLFSGPEFYKTLLQTSFEGASGRVSFDPITGTRASKDVRYAVRNMVVMDDHHSAKDDGDIVLYARRAASIVGETVLRSQETPFLFAGNSTIPPSSLPSLEVEHNLIPPWALAFGYVLGSAALVSSVAGMLWTVRYNKDPLVQVSQPLFLHQLCLGAFFMALAIFPMSLQGEEESAALDAACMASPWLLYLGFVVASSALFAKSWRLRKLLASAQSFRRIKVEPKDVMLPFLVLFTVNVILLSIWTVIMPYSYQRIVDTANLDTFGRAIETYGQCQSSPDNPSVQYVLVPLILINLGAVAIGARSLYEARRMPTEYSESKHLAISMAFLLEGIVLGVPVLFVAGKSSDPTASYTVTSILIFVLCMSLLIPVFVPKVLEQRRRRRTNDRRMPSILASVARSSSTGGHQPLKGSLVRTSASAFSSEFNNGSRAVSSIELWSSEPQEPDGWKPGLIRIVRRD